MIQLKEDGVNYIITYKKEHSEKLIGRAVKEVDGYFYFEPFGEGLYSEQVLRDISLIIVGLNRSWDKQVQKATKKKLKWWWFIPFIGLLFGYPDNLKGVGGVFYLIYQSLICAFLFLLIWIKY